MPKVWRLIRRKKTDNPKRPKTRRLTVQQVAIGATAFVLIIVGAVYAFVRFAPAPRMSGAVVGVALLLFVAWWQERGSHRSHQGRTLEDHEQWKRFKARPRFTYGVTRRAWREVGAHLLPDRPRLISAEEAMKRGFEIVAEVYDPPPPPPPKLPAYPIPLVDLAKDARTEPTPVMRSPRRQVQVEEYNVEFFGRHSLLFLLGRVWLPLLFTIGFVLLTVRFEGAPIPSFRLWAAVLALLSIIMMGLLSLEWVFTYIIVSEFDVIIRRVPHPWLHWYPGLDAKAHMVDIHSCTEARRWYSWATGTGDIMFRMERMEKPEPLFLPLKGVAHFRELSNYIDRQSFSQRQAA